MIEFDDAIAVASSNAKTLIKKAKNFILEGVLLSDDNKLFEVTLSYDLNGKDPFGVENPSNGLAGNNSLTHLARIMSYRREYKVFLVDSSTGKFRGFKSQTNR